MTDERRADHAIHMAELLVAHPDGRSIYQLAEDMGISYGYAQVILHELREMCGQLDSINVICDRDPDVPNGPWLYKLVGNLEAAKPWLGNRVGDAETRLRTLYSVVASLERGVDGRSVDGRRTRVMKKGLGRLIEDIDELNLNHTS